MLGAIGGMMGAGYGSQMGYLRNEGKQNQQQQDQLAGQMQSIAMGQKAGMGEAQLRAGLHQAMGQQMGAANAARGGGLAQALAQRGAQVAGGQMQQNAGVQAAQMKAQEQQAMMQQAMAARQAQLQQGLQMAALRDQATMSQLQAGDQLIGSVAGMMTGAGGLGMLG